MARELFIVLLSQGNWWLVSWRENIGPFKTEADTIAMAPQLIEFYGHPGQPFDVMAKQGGPKYVACLSGVVQGQAAA